MQYFDHDKIKRKILEKCYDFEYLEKLARCPAALSRLLKSRPDNDYRITIPLLKKIAELWDMSLEELLS